MSQSETQTDVIGKWIKLAMQTDSISPPTAYYKAEAKHCLVKAVRDFLFYVRYAYLVSK